MKKSGLLVSSLLLSSVLVACNSNDDTNSEQPISEPNESTEVNDNEDVNDASDDLEDSEDTEDNDETNADDENEDNNSTESVLSDGNFEDQLDLEIGDTGDIETLNGIFSITLNDVKMMEEIDGEMSDLDYFLIANVTIKNIGDEDIDAKESINVMEATDFLEGTGYSDESEFYDQFETFEGVTIGAGEEVTAEALYVAHDADEYYLRIREGLVGSGAAKNQIMFTFNKNEIE